MLAWLFAVSLTIAAELSAAAGISGSGVSLGPDARTQDVTGNLILTMHLAATDSSMAAYLAHAGLLQVPDSAIVLAQDSALCRRALNAYNVRKTNHVNAAAVYVLRAGSRYIVTEPAGIGEFSGAHVVFDTAFAYKGGYVY